MKILSQYRDALIDSIIFLYPKMNYTYLDVFPVLQETQKKQEIDVIAVTIYI